MRLAAALALLVLLVCTAVAIAPHTGAEAGYDARRASQPPVADSPNDEDESPPAPTTRRSYHPDESAISNLGDLQREVEAYIAGSEGAIAVALMANSHDVLFAVNADTPMPLASVVKLHILIAMLRKIDQEDRARQDFESDLLDALITYSDNGSADYLWQLLGGDEALDTYFAETGVTAASVGRDGYWGDTLDSASGTATVLARLSEGTLLSAESTSYALGLLGSIVSDQRWGVSAGLPAASEEPDLVLLKNGWYPDEDGWRVNSAGIIRPGDGPPSYVLVVLSYGQPSFDYGVETVETISALTNHLMHSSTTALAVRR